MSTEAEDAADRRAQMDVLRATLERDWPEGVDVEQILDPAQRARAIAADEKLRELMDQDDQVTES